MQARIGWGFAVHPRNASQKGNETGETGEKTRVLFLEICLFLTGLTGLTGLMSPFGSSH